LFGDVVTAEAVTEGKDMLDCGLGNDFADGGLEADEATGCETIVDVP
jgi:hypothetical protein